MPVYSQTVPRKSGRSPHAVLWCGAVNRGGGMLHTFGGRRALRSVLDSRYKSQSPVDVES